MQLDFEITATGFELAQTDLAIGTLAVAPASEEAVPLPDRNRPALTRRGELWLPGECRLLFGDARNPEDYQRLIQGRKADVGFIVPPDDVSINGHVCGNGRVQHRVYAEASGEKTADEFETFPEEALGQETRHFRDGAVWFTFMDWRHAGALDRAVVWLFAGWLNLCFWAKTDGGNR